MTETPQEQDPGFSNVPDSAPDGYQPGWDTVQVYPRTDGKFAWRYMSANGVDKLAVDGSQGYENEADARSAAGRVTGFSAEVKTARRGLRFERVEA